MTSNQLHSHIGAVLYHTGIIDVEIHGLQSKVGNAIQNVHIQNEINEIVSGLTADNFLSEIECLHSKVKERDSLSIDIDAIEKMATIQAEADKLIARFDSIILRIENIKTVLQNQQATTFESFEDMLD